MTAYGRSKLAGEAAVTAGALPWVIVRPPTVYGPRDREVLKVFRMARWGVAPIFGDGSQELSAVHGADLAAALPQAFSQLSSTIEQAIANQVLSMDAMTDESDPAMAIGVAGLHLEEARGLAVDLHKHLNAARNATAHIISQGVDDGHGSMPWDQP